MNPITILVLLDGTAPLGCPLPMKKELDQYPSIQVFTLANNIYLLHGLAHNSVCLQSNARWLSALTCNKFSYMDTGSFRPEKFPRWFEAKQTRLKYTLKKINSKQLILTSRNLFSLLFEEGNWRNSMDKNISFHENKYTVILNEPPFHKQINVRSDEGSTKKFCNKFLVNFWWFLREEYFGIFALALLLRR